MRYLITGRMRHGDCYLIFQLVFSQLVPGVKTVAFKYGLDT